MKKPIMIAHRGYSGAYRENTELAFIKAAEHLSGGAETDIRITKDGIYVTHHNASADFEDGSSLVISESTFEELTAKPLFNNKTEDKVYITTYKRYLEIMKENNMICFVELKGSFSDEQVKEIFGMADEIYDLKKVILQSFDFDNLIKAHGFFPEMPLMLTYGASEKNWERCFDYGFSIDIDQYVVTEEIVDEFHKRGLEVGVWTVNDEENLKRIKAMNVNYIESDIFGGEK